MTSVHGRGALFFAAVLLLSSCTDRMHYQNPSLPAERRAADLLKRMTLEEKILQASQYFTGDNDNVNNFGEAADIPPGIGSVIYLSADPALANALQHKAVEETRLGIPILFGYDVIHGFQTIFPIPLAQACSWNPDLVARADSIAALEAYSAGIRWTFAPMVDIARDPRWGRIMEGYGEDPYAVSVFCRAAVRGFQGSGLSQEGSLAACLKHYAGYGASEAGRDYVQTDISSQTLWDTYLPPFHAGVEAGVASVMSAFNTLNGIPATGNHYLLSEVLKKKWNFDGFVVADWCAVDQLVNQGMAVDQADAARIALEAGVDMDMCDWAYRNTLATLVEQGSVSRKRLDDAVLRILTVKFRLGLFEHPYTEERPDSARFLLPEYLSAARSLAEEAIVLLKNEGGVLPLNSSMPVALTGPFAEDAFNMNGNWSAYGARKAPVSIAEGLRKDFPNLTDRTASAGTVICCIGQKGAASGENCSYSTIDLDPEQEELVLRLKQSGKKVIVVLTNGRPLALGRIEPYADAIVETWHLGTMAGDAVSAVLSGRVNPSGKLAVTFPLTSGQIPIYYNRRPSGRTGDQGRYKDISSEPLYPFGHGLSYAEFEYGPVTLSRENCRPGDTVIASVTITNRSSVDGMETVMWYIRDVAGKMARPEKELKFFQKVSIPAGESRECRFIIDPNRDLATVDGTGKKVLEAGSFLIMAGGGEAELVLESTE